jgi:NAD(P)-dependent dehydrogenase (short-subunit alcohol dehydrogenase family)
MGFEDIGFEQWQNIVNINLTGSFLCAQAAFADEEPAAAERAHHQQRLDLGMRPGQFRATRDQTHAITGLTKSISGRAQSTTLPCGQIDISNAMTQLAARVAKGVPQSQRRIAVE